MTTTPLPARYAAWIEAALGGPLPDESRATCGTCVMCIGPGGAAPEEPNFLPGTKCCTYFPRLPSFNVGWILADDSPEAAPGRERVVERVRGRLGATPLGVFPGPGYRGRFDEARQSGEFGRRADLICPYLDGRDGGRCTIWRHREAVCSTFFCKHVDGVKGARLWSAVGGLLRAVERELVARCLVELDLGDDAIAELYDHEQAPRDLVQSELRGWVAEDGHVDEGLARRLWGRWFGREEEFYLECGRWVGGLDWHQVRAGAALELAEVQARRAWAACATPAAMDALVFAPVDTCDLNGGLVSIRSVASPWDPVRVPAAVAAALGELDGRPTRAVLAELRGRGVELDDSVVDALVSRGVLVPLDERDVPRAADGPLRPDERLAFFRGHQGFEVVVVRGPGENGAETLTIQCANKEISFDEPHLLPFGRRLIERQNGFLAGEAASWAEAVDWAQACELLEALLAERVLIRVRAGASEPR